MMNCFVRSAAALKIHISQECKDILDKLGGYKLESRGPITLKVES